MNAAIGNNIENWLKIRKMTVESFANQMEVTRQTVYNWMKGEADPTFRQVAKMSMIIECRIDELFFIKGIKQP